MRTSPPTAKSRETRSRRAVAIVVGAALAIALFALALVFSSAAGASRVAENARALHWANATAGTAAVTRAAVSQAVVFAVDRELGVADDQAVAAATAEATHITDELERWFGATDSSLIEDAGLITARGTDLVTTARTIIDFAESGRAVAADNLFRTDFEAEYKEVTDRLMTMQNEIADRISSTESAANNVGTITRLLVTLLIPAAAILVYFMLARRQYREAQVQMEAKLEAERELNRSKDEFIAGISHELRTPLTSIFGFSEYLIEKGIIDPTEAMELVGLINADSVELSRMVEDLLTAARLDSNALTFEPEAVAVMDEVETVTAPLNRSGSKIFVEGRDAIVWADRARTRQILRNLVSNAIRHGGTTTKVLVETRDGVLALTVTDDGAGVPDEIADRLFERFVHDGSTALLAGSVGLGLSIARSLAQSMGGDVTYLRALGSSNFVLTLPLASEEQIAAAPRDLPNVSEEPPILTLELPEEEATDDLASIRGMPGWETRTDSNFTVDF
jgi:signal transduction histidine kinase